MIDIKNHLVSKYGECVHKEQASLIMNIKNLSKKSYYHTLYDAVSKDHYCKEQLEFIKLDPTYGAFMSQYNGCRLYTDNLSIYGFQNDKDYYVPLDFVHENQMLEQYKCPFVCIGGIGLDYHIAYKGNKLVVISFDDFEILKTYNNFEEFLTDYLSYADKVALANRTFEKKVVRSIDYDIDMQGFFK